MSRIFIIHHVRIIFLMTLFTSCSVQEQDQSNMIQNQDGLLNFIPPRAYSRSNFNLSEDGLKRTLGFKNDSMIVSYIVISSELENPKIPLVFRVGELGKFANSDVLLFNKDSTIIYAADSEGRFKSIFYRINDTDHIMVAYKFYQDTESDYDDQFDLIIEHFDLR